MCGAVVGNLSEMLTPPQIPFGCACRPSVGWRLVHLETRVRSSAEGSRPQIHSLGK